ncbi:MAG: protein-disulfide reductase DsbD family protein [Saprospiraceae bacterium]|nr:protein-disulfide reductase DsbD family protein [Saprospiraceae bacterium]
MKYFLPLLLALGLLTTQAYAQIFTPVQWSHTYQDLGNNEYLLVFKATIDEGWVVYSQYLPSDEGPIPTSFVYEEGSHFSLIGPNEESGNKKESYDKFFDMSLIKFSGEGIFSQKVKVTDPTQPIKGYVEYMTCNDERCLPPTEEAFEIVITAAEGQPDGKTSTGSAALPEGILDPVQWALEANQTEAGQYTLRFTANIEVGWTIYSQFTDENGPVPTSFDYQLPEGIQLSGGTVELSKTKSGPDPIFDNANVIKFVENPVYFEQKVQVMAKNAVLEGFLVFMTCDDERCLPPKEVPFRVSFDPLIATIGEDAVSDLLVVPGENDAAATRLFSLDPANVQAPLQNCGPQTAEIKSAGIWSIFFLGFIGGLIALLTPCVFPMIPLTVSFFTKSSKTKKKGLQNAFAYGAFIFLIYALLSIPFHLMDSINPDILNDISTNVWLNLSFFVIFVFFAFSFFGYYELTLPSSWANKASNAEGVGGLLGIFFMALTLALVSFSCTGPILGSLLAGALSSDGGAWQLTAGMSGFGFALALPFALFAAFPGWLNTLPKSGGWLNTVKVVLGFAELALALKFLSNADLVKHWGLLKIEPFLILWILISLGLAAYLFGWIKFPHDSRKEARNLVKSSLGVLSLAFALYLLTGFRTDEQAGSYTPLKLLSGLAPPVCYSIWQPCDCPQSLSCYKDFDAGMAAAKASGKPVLIDFTGHACVNCRKMEEHVWPEREVYGLLKEEYILISLYVDEKIDLPEEEQIVVETVGGQTRKLRNVGHKWSHFQTTYFNTNSQPYYVLLSPEGQLLNQPVGYTPDPETFAAFLQCGLDAHNKQ